MSKSKGGYVSVGLLQYRSDLDDKKSPTRTYKPGDTIHEDLSDKEIERFLAKGVIREASLVKKEQAAREDAALLAQQAEDAADAATAAVVTETAAEADVKAAAGDKSGKGRK